jgi:hypothetical protein
VFPGRRSRWCRSSSPTRSILDSRFGAIQIIWLPFAASNSPALWTLDAKKSLDGSLDFAGPHGLIVSSSGLDSLTDAARCLRPYLAIFRSQRNLITTCHQRRRWLGNFRGLCLPGGDP